MRTDSAFTPVGCFVAAAIFLLGLAAIFLAPLVAIILGATRAAG